MCGPNEGAWPPTGPTPFPTEPNGGEGLRLAPPTRGHAPILQPRPYPERLPTDWPRPESKPRPLPKPHPPRSPAVNQWEGAGSHGGAWPREGAGLHGKGAWPGKGAGSRGRGAASETGRGHGVRLRSGGGATQKGAGLREGVVTCEGRGQLIGTWEGRGHPVATPPSPRPRPSH